MAGGACLGSDGFAPLGKLGDMGPPIEVAQRFLNRRRCNMSARGADKGNLPLRPSTCAPDRRRGGKERCEAQHAAEISMAELHAAVLDRAAVRSG